MSEDQLASSFGDPNAQPPPTPKQTPTSAAFPSPVFETPKARQTSRFDDPGSWTPRFAEEYSVFNATPGNLRGSHGPFPDFAPATPFHSSTTGLKRALSAGVLAAEIATHVNHFSPDPSLPLPPVDPSRCLPSSPSTLTGAAHEFSGEEDIIPDSPVGRQSASKKARTRAGASTDLTAACQVATPPPSARKGERKLAPRQARTTAMHHEQEFGHPDFVVGTPQQQNMAAFVNSPSDLFGYPMSAPAAAPANFWDPSAPDMSGMDMDFSAFDQHLFQTPTPGQRSMASFDPAQLFQETLAPPLQPTAPLPPATSKILPSSNQENVQPAKRERALAPKTTLTLPSQVAPSTSAATEHPIESPVDDPFGIISPDGVVNPGLLFTQSQPLNVDASFSKALPQLVSAGQPSVPSSSHPQARSQARGSIRRSTSTKEVVGNRLLDRTSASSPVKPLGRPGLQRSFSENRGRRGLVRGGVPSITPAVRSVSQTASGSGVGRSPVLVRPSGRMSPLKQQHSRIASLTSIPETTGPRTRTSVRFTIDAKGRARAETTLVVGEDDSGLPNPRGSHYRRTSRDTASSGRDRDWGSSDESSSTDDEPIIIPSRNASFALPDPRKPSSSSYFHSSQRSISDQSTSTQATFAEERFPGSHNGDDGSDAETVMNEQARSGKGGDAASELRRLVESRQKQAVHGSGGQRAHRLLSGNFGNYTGTGHLPNARAEGSMPTSSLETRSQSVRCVCNRHDSGREVQGFMVQCESCELWLHGKCINISRRTLPNVYICAFCANTPNMRGGRMRDSGRAPMVPPTTSATSPLAHKSFRSFR